MDPDETLRMIRRYVMLLENADNVAPSTTAQRGVELAEYVGILDQWLSRDGFLPKDWDHS